MMRVMASLKVFDIVYMMIEKTNPAIRSCETILYNFYQETFVKNNKGYGSAEHIKALQTLGPTPIHRRSFIGHFV